MKHRSTWQLSLVTLAVVLGVAACGESTSSKAGPDFESSTPTDNNSGNTGTDDGFNQSSLIASIVDNVITPTYQQFLTDSQAQISKVEEYCTQEKAQSDTVVETKQSAQQAWRDAMTTWQQAEVMQLGPLSANSSSLRNKIYSWPVVNRCAVDQDVVIFESGTSNGEPYDISKRTEPRRGMDALEYLLFNDNLATSCTNSLVAPTGWDNRTPESQKIARCEFAIEVAKDIANSAQTLVTEWTKSDGFADKLKAAGEADSEYADVHDAVNVISDAMFYIDSVTKDNKLGKTLGLSANVCGAQACPEQVESPYSQHSIENIAANLVALQKLFNGDDGTGEAQVGFDDYLKDVGDEDTATQLAADIINAISTSKAYTQSLAETLANNPDTATQSHADVKKVTDNLKTDFIKSLALELPKTSAGDND